MGYNRPTITMAEIIQQTVIKDENGNGVATVVTKNSYGDEKVGTYKIDYYTSEAEAFQKAAQESLDKHTR